MLFDLDHHSGVPIYRQIIDQVRRQIMAGQLPEGFKLHSVRELARHLRVNPMTVSKAYAILEIEQLVQRTRGVGLFVAPLQKENKEKTKNQLLEQSMKKTVTTAIQLGIDHDQAAKLMQKLYRKYNSKSRSRK
jgi:GntR family transcriptional regulator